MSSSVIVVPWWRIQGGNNQATAPFPPCLSWRSCPNTFFQLWPTIPYFLNSRIFSLEIRPSLKPLITPTNNWAHEVRIENGKENEWSVKMFINNISYNHQSIWVERSFGSYKIRMSHLKYSIYLFSFLTFCEWRGTLRDRRYPSVYDMFSAISDFLSSRHDLLRDWDILIHEFYNL